MIGNFLRLLPYARRQWPWLAVIAVLTVFSSLAAVFQPWPLKILVDYALGGAKPQPGLDAFLQLLRVDGSAGRLIVFAAVASLLLFALNSAFNSLMSWAWTSAGQRMVYDLAADVLARLQRLSLRFHSRRDIGDSLDRLSTDTYCVYSMAEGLFVGPAQHALTLVGIGLAAWSLSPLLTLISFGAAPMLVLAARYFGPKLKRQARDGREAQAQLLSFVHQTLSAVPVAQAFNTEKRNTHHYSRLADQAVTTTQRGALLQSLAGVVSGLTKVAGMAVILIVGGRQVLSGQLSVGSLLVFIAYVRSLHDAFDKLFQTYGKLKFTEASVARVLEILDSKEVTGNRDDLPPLPDLPHGQRGRVAFEHVTFCYEPGRPVLNDVSLTVQPGETLAIVGPTGAGKSTLVSLIPRLYDATSGRVTFDGCDVRDVQLQSLRQAIAVVPQDPYLLPFSIAENIALGCSNASEAAIQAAATAANADEFIQRLPHGYDTVIGKQGATLSGGEKQRLAIARAVLKDAAVVILDEPTSALDSRTESSVLEALSRLTAGRTTFIIAHRLSTIQRADRIVVLKEGEIVEAGTHEELIGRAGHFHHLHTLQSSPFAEGVTS